MEGRNRGTAKAFSPLRARMVGRDPGTAKDARPCGLERRGWTLVCEGRLASAGQNGGARPWCARAFSLLRAEGMESVAYIYIYTRADPQQNA